MSWCIVMMKQPWPRFPQISSFLPHWAHQTSQDVFVDVLINSSALWQEFCVDDSTDIKKRDQHHFGFGLEHLRLFGSWWQCALPFKALEVDRTRKSMTHRQLQLFSVSWVQFRVAPKCLDTLAHAAPFVLHSATLVQFLLRPSSSPHLPEWSSILSHYSYPAHLLSF